jgi:hypothetical protein
MSARRPASAISAVESSAKAAAKSELSMIFVALGYLTLSCAQAANHARGRDSPASCLTQV